jgi:hypothetical protein
VDNKLSDRSISGTFIGHSPHGNGYIFLVPNPSGATSGPHQYDEIDSRDVKFNETFAPCRERKGKLSNGSPIPPDLMTTNEYDSSNNNAHKPDSVPAHDQNFSNNDLPATDPTTPNVFGRGMRIAQPRQFLHPGTHSTDTVAILEPLATPINLEFQIREHQYANLCMNLDKDEHATFIMACMASQRYDEELLTKELELLMGCTAMNDDLILHADANLAIPDPTSQREIDRMDPPDAKRFNDATIAEVNGMKKKGVMELSTLDSLPFPTKIYQSVVNWTYKTNLGVYVKTKCRICFGGHRYD